jgi:hypothetical protein
MPTKKEAARLTAQENALCALGFTPDEADRLRRVSLTLRRWHELECGIDGGCIERDDATGRPYWRADSGRRWPVADRETGALLRLQSIIYARNARMPEPVWTYIQPDPRGAALYILRPGDVPAGERADSYYSRGLCVH